MSSGKVTCKQCKKQFSFEEWNSNKVCDNENCQRPCAQTSMQMAKKVIHQIQENLRNNIEVKYNDIPNNYNDESKSLYYYEVPQVMVTLVTPKNRKG